MQNIFANKAGGDKMRQKEIKKSGTATNPISDKPYNRDKFYKRQTLYATNVISD